MKIEIIKLERGNSLLNYNCCMCKHNMALNSHAVAIGSQICHLICYKNIIKRQMNNLDMEKLGLECELAMLEPYKKEMICESLEKE